MDAEQKKQEQAPQFFRLPAQLRESLLRYLYSRPYAEVADGVLALTNLSPAE